MAPRSHCGLPPSACVISYIWTNFPSGHTKNITLGDLALHIDLVVPCSDRMIFKNYDKIYIMQNLPFQQLLSTVYYSGVLGTFILLCHHHYHPSPGFFIFPNRNSAPIKYKVPIALPLNPRNHHFTFVYKSFYSREVAINEIMWYL